MKRPVVIATSRSWNEFMAESVSALSERETVLITKKEELSREALESIQPEFVFFPHWSYIIPAEIHESFECVVFHMTDLPFGRGGSPLQNLIVRGVEQTKISALKVVEGLDAGPIYMKRDLVLAGSAEEIFLRAAKIVEAMIVEILKSKPQAVPQSGEPTEFRRRKPAESDLGATEFNTIEKLYDFIRMLDAPGYPRAFLEMNGYRIELEKAHRTAEGIQGGFKIHKL